MSRKIWIALLFFSILAFLPVATLFQTSPGDETPEETLSRSSRNLHQWGAISSFHGLPSEKVHAIGQTPDGFLWFGTDNGLARFDGRRVETNIFSNLSSVPINALETDEAGTLWIGSNIGAFYASDGAISLVRETENISINSILTSDGTIYLTNEAGTVFRCTKTENSYSAEMILNEDVPIRVSATEGSDLLLGSLNRGLLKIVDGKTEGIRTQPRPFFINVLKRDRDGKLWIGARSTNDKSGLFASSKLPVLKVVGQDLGTVNAIAFDSYGNKWVGTDERGIFLFEGEKLKNRYSFSNTSGSLRSDQILDIFVDREDVIWIGTDEGVNRFDPISPRNEKISDNTQSNFVRVVASSKTGTILAGTNRGLYLSTGGTAGWRNVFEGKTILVIEERTDDSWYIGTTDGLYVYDNRLGTTGEIRKDLDVRAIVRFKGQVYVSSFGSGLFRLDAENDRLILPENVVSLHAEGDERLWIGTTAGKLRTFDGEKLSPVFPLPDDANPSIWSITGNTRDGIWLSTNHGLYLLKDAVIQPLLTSFNIRQTLVIEGSDGKKRLWCAAEEGLFTLLYDNRFGWISSGSDIDQGFASQNMFSLASVDKASLIVGTNRGIVRKVIPSTKPLIAAIRVLSQRLHQPRELVTGIDLEYPQNTLSVEVTALSSRTFPEEFQYSFLLFDDSGKVIKKRFTDKEEFLMDNLPPGKYRVEIRAFNRNLTGSDPLVFSVSVSDAPFPLIATILAVLLVIAVTALIWATYSQQKSFRTSKELAVANKELNNARLNLANEAERERHRIARDLHDQTLADLRHLILMADDVQTEKALKFRSEIEGISDEIRRICEDLSPSVLENIGFTAALEWELGNAVEQVSDKQEIETIFQAEDGLDEVLNLNRAEQIQIYRIAQEVLNNIVRHAHPAKIVLQVGKTDEEELRLVITDNGTGFEPGEVTNKKGRGLTNIKARAQLIKAEIAWKKLPSQGTEFELQISERAESRSQRTAG